MRENVHSAILESRRAVEEDDALRGDRDVVDRPAGEPGTAQPRERVALAPERADAGRISGIL